MINKLKKVFNNRKSLYFIFSIVLVSVFTLTIAYSALNTVLMISGNAEVTASNWDIYLANPQVVSGSVTTDIPVITDKTTASFTTTLTNPGDYYMFTIDVVNNGTIDAMIDSIEKIPTLTEQQTKYLNYIVEYQSGDSITSRQLVEAKSFVRLKVKVEFRKDISSTDLPTTSETLKLSFKVNYVQADELNNSIVQNNGKLVRVVSGDGTQVGDEVCIDTECFYVISSTDDDVTMFAKYNLYVGYILDFNWNTSIIENSLGIQNEIARGWISDFSDSKPIIGIKPFSSTNYWSSSVTEYPAYVYNENSYLYEYVENYKDYLEGLGIIIQEARLISQEELKKIGCIFNDYTCTNAPKWVYLTTYWTGTATTDSNLWIVNSVGDIGGNNYTDQTRRGVRPVIVISKSEF